MDRFRRNMLVTMGAAPLVLGAPSLFAQKKIPQAGVDYRELSPALPPESKTRIEVIEFFWYGCPHCYEFEPVVEPWIKKLPADVNFHRVPAVFDDSWIVDARLYCTLEAMGQVERLHGKIFEAKQKEHVSFADEKVLLDWLGKNGIARDKYLETAKSFGVQNKLTRAKQLQAAYKIDGVPTMGIDGKYATSATMAGNSHEAVPPIVDYLVGEVRKSHRSAK